MKFGVTIFPHAAGLPPVELGLLVEDHGFESLFFPEHSHVPVGVDDHPDGGEMPLAYKAAFSPLMSIASIVSATSTLRLGTGICIVPQHDPINLAKEIATIDVLSGGRFIFGVAAGWNDDELRNHGVDPSKRWTALEERLEAIRLIWTEDQPEFHGETVDFDRIWQWPKPVQNPHPEILMGGNSPAAIKRAARLGTGWLPRRRRSQDRFAQDFKAYREHASEAGFERPSITVYEAQDDPEYLEFYASSGIERCVFLLPDSPADEIRQKVEDLAQLCSAFGD